MTSDLELLEQRISELEAENAGLRSENVELKDENAKLRKIIDENSRRDARIKEVEARLAILEQGVAEVTGQPQNDKEVITEVSAVDAFGSVIDQQNEADIKAVEEVAPQSDKEIDDFIPEEAVNVPEEKHNLGIEQENGNISSRKNLSLSEKAMIPASPSFCEEGRKTDEFLVSVHKKKVSDEIRVQDIIKLLIIYIIAFVLFYA
jgi:hypothetical protein